MSKARAAAAPRIALALAGGGPLGAAYEIGALCALEEALPGVDFTRLQHYVGVSAGGFLAAALANGIGPRALCAAFAEDAAPDAEVFDPAWLLAPAYGEFARRALRLPGLALGRFSAVLPTGLCSSEEVQRRLARVFSQPGRSNDFRQLRSRLTLVATDLASGQAVAFGGPGWNHVPISRAVQASAALPGLFPPVPIEGRCFVDGALQKTLHASAALEHGVDLMLCVNPLVPFAGGGIADAGLPAVLGQTFRALLHSRLALARKRYARDYPGTEILLVEPEARDARVNRAHILGYRQRGELAGHAYQQVRALLLQQYDALAPRLARHGITLSRAALADPTRALLAAPRPDPHPRPRLRHALADLRATLDTLERRLQPA